MVSVRLTPGGSGENDDFVFGVCHFGARDGVWIGKGVYTFFGGGDIIGASCRGPLLARLGAEKYPSIER